MSRSNPPLTNPANRIFQWSGSKGRLEWYNKERDERVPVDMPFHFMVIDQLATISGYNPQLGRIWANEVRAISKEEFYVRTKSGPFEAGLYANLAQTPRRGGKYAKVIYIAYQENNEWVMGKIVATGASLGAWIDFGKSNKQEEGKITLTLGEAQDGVSGQYFVPKFTWGKCSVDENNAAIVLDTQLQKFLEVYLKVSRDEDGYEIAPDNTDEALATPEQQADFDRRREQGIAAKRGDSVEIEDIDDTPPANPDVVIEDIGDEPINLDDIPF